MLEKGRNKFEDKKFTLAIFACEDDFLCDELKYFCCGRDDLDDFFQHDAVEHKKQLLAETFYFQPKKATRENHFSPVAFVSYLNDKIEVRKENRKTDLKDFVKFLRKEIPYPKRNYKTFPAVKIGRLGVCTRYQRQGIGTAILNLTKEIFVTENRTGCRFLTVDAYNDKETLEFYSKNGFEPLWKKDVDQATRTMYYDLMLFKNQLRSEIQSD